MFDHVIKCMYIGFLLFFTLIFCSAIVGSLLSDERVPPNLFRNWNRPFISSVKKHKVAHNQTKSAQQEYRSLRKHLSRVHKMEETLSQKGIEFKCVVVNRPTGLSKTQPAKGTDLEAKTPEKRTIKKERELLRKREEANSSHEDSVIFKPISASKLRLIKSLKTKNKRRRLLVIPRLFPKLRGGLKI